MTESELFNVVRMLSQTERESYLTKACAGDLGLRKRVEELLQAHAEIEETLDPNATQGIDLGQSPAAFPDRSSEDQEAVTLDTRLSSPDDLRDKALRANASIGPYKLLQLLGQGGMGEVWMAEQSEPVKRRVALKVIKAGIGSKEILARFEAERQALALMNHPNIARILDAGTTPEGQPYFAMELVNGKPLTTYCDDNRLSVDERLHLFDDVCQGVQHAHQKGIIHRDLKPGNILVTVADGKAVPKVIDFGLAKAMESTQRLTDQSLFTGIGQILGTLKYMSPEQASFDIQDIDTRTDIYALGVILYELLTGSTPLDDSSIKGQAALKILEFIRDREPVKPSSKLNNSTDEQVSTITGQRKTDSVRLNRVLAGDLDWIVMKSLEKDRTRRYESASGFAADIQRYLNNEPVMARPPSMNYRVRKFVRKNRLGVTAALLVLMALLAGISGTSLGLYRALAAERLANERLQDANRARAQESEQRIVAEIARTRAEDETRAKEKALAEEVLQRQYAQAVTDFLENDFLALTNIAEQSDLPQNQLGRELNKDTTLRELLDRSAEKLMQRKNLAPAIEARLCNVIGMSYVGNGDADKGIPFLETALKLRREQIGKEHPETLSSMHNLAFGYQNAMQFGMAIQLYEQTITLRKAVLAPDHLHTCFSLNNLAACYDSVGQTIKALPLWEQSLELMTKNLGANDPKTIISMNNLAFGYRNVRQLDKAVTIWEKTLELTKANLGSDHPTAIITMNNMAMIYQELGNIDKALPLLETVVTLSKSKFGSDHPQTLACMNNLALVYFSSGQQKKSLPIWEQVLELTMTKFGSTHPDTLKYMSNLATGYHADGQFDKALSLAEKSFEIKTATLGAEHPETLIGMNNLAMSYKGIQKMDRAVQLFERLLEIQIRKFGRNDPATQTTVESLGITYKDLGRIEEAIPLLEEAVANGQQLPNIRRSKRWLREAYFKGRRVEQYVQVATEELKEARASLPAESSALASLLFSQGREHLAFGEYERAHELLQECLNIRQKIAPELWSTFNAQSLLGAAMVAKSKAVGKDGKDGSDVEFQAKLTADAQLLLVAGYEGMKQRESTIPPTAANCIPEALDRLIRLFMDMNQPDKVNEYTELRKQYPESAETY
jgi:serine/threonine protein kinase/tetratricopeptide (TPR) repeat protein